MSGVLAHTVGAAGKSWEVGGISMTPADYSGIWTGFYQGLFGSLSPTAVPEGFITQLYSAYNVNENVLWLIGNVVPVYPAIKKVQLYVNGVYKFTYTARTATEYVSTDGIYPFSAGVAVTIKLVGCS